MWKYIIANNSTTVTNEIKPMTKVLILDVTLHVLLTLTNYIKYYILYWCTEVPYVRVVGNSSILATVGSRPVIEFMVAVDSNGVVEFQNNVTSLLTFIFLSNSSQEQIQLPLPVMDSDNFQHYSYTLPPVGINNEGLYTLTINGMLAIIM